MNKSALGFAVMALVLVVPAPAFALHGAQHAAQDSAKTAAVDALLAPTAPGSPGLAVAIYRAGTVEYVQGYGLAHLEPGTQVTPRTRFNVPIVSTEFTPLALPILERHSCVSGQSVSDS